MTHAATQAEVENLLARIEMQSAWHKPWNMVKGGVIWDSEHEVVARFELGHEDEAMFMFSYRDMLGQMAKRINKLVEALEKISLASNPDYDIHSWSALVYQIGKLADASVADYRGTKEGE